jgi:hypothetical protein
MWSPNPRQLSATVSSVRLQLSCTSPGRLFKLQSNDAPFHSDKEPSWNKIESHFSLMEKYIRNVWLLASSSRFVKIVLEKRELLHNTWPKKSKRRKRHYSFQIFGCTRPCQIFKDNKNFLAWNFKTLTIQTWDIQNWVTAYIHSTKLWRNSWSILSTNWKK